MGLMQGTWKDFESHEKGNLISLIERQYQYDFKQALQYAAEWAGIAPETKLTQTKPKMSKGIIDIKALTEKQTFDAHQLDKIEYAKRLVENSAPIKGTLAERYLQEYRGLTGSASEESFRFNPAVYEPSTQQYCPALIVIARNDQHDAQAVQCIYLNPETRTKNGH